MVKSYHKAVYKPDSQSTDEFIVVIGDLDAANKWIAGGAFHSLLPNCFERSADSFFFSQTGTSSSPVLPRQAKSSPLSPYSTIPLVEIVDSFDVFHTGQGSQGYLARPSKQELETVFGSSNENVIVETVLSKGRILSSDTPHQWTSKNEQRSGNYQSSHGATGGGR
ncbi:hypothetical protein JCM8097_006311 [Rhodosporidiobolus ruineniae]